MESKEHDKFMRRAIRLSRDNTEKGLDGPFGAVVVKDGKIIASSANKVITSMDPTAHAEVAAIRKACKKLKTFDLSGCIIYTSCEPCPMCLGAIYWAKIDTVYYANTREDAGNIGFDDQFIYEELALAPPKRKLALKQLLRAEALDVFKSWESSPLKMVF